MSFYCSGLLGMMQHIIMSHSRVHNCDWTYHALYRSFHRQVCSMAVFTCGEKATWETPPYPLSRPTYTISLSHSRIMDLTQYHSRRMHSCTLCTVFWEGLPSLKPLLTQSQLTPLSLKTSSPPPLLTLVSALPPLSCILAFFFCTIYSTYLEALKGAPGYRLTT